MTAKQVIWVQSLVKSLNFVIFLLNSSKNNLCKEIFFPLFNINVTAAFCTLGNWIILNLALMNSLKARVYTESCTGFVKRWNRG